MAVRLTPRQKDLLDTISSCGRSGYALFGKDEHDIARKLEEKGHIRIDQDDVATTPDALKGDAK